MKIAISGAGIAGPALAYWLKRSGHEPTLIERAPAFRTGGYVIDFWGIGYRVIERMGLESAVQEAGYAVGEIRNVDRHGRTLARLSTASFERSTGGKFTSLPRGDLAATIFAAVEPAVETLFDNSITALEQDEHGVRVNLERGGERAFDLVIGADGLHSNVRGLVFGPDHPFEHYLGYRVAAFVVDGYRPRDELVYLTCNAPGRQVARFSLRGDRTLILFVYAAANREGATDLDARKAELCREFADLGWECPGMLEALRVTDELYYDNVSQIRMDRWSHGRVLLLGDAAACVSLLAGEGSGLAIAEAYVLAGELQRAGGDHRLAFAAYENRLRRFIEGKQSAAERFASTFAPRTRLGLWLRAQAMRAMAFEPLAHLLLGRSLRDDLELPDYGM